VLDFLWGRPTEVLLTALTPAALGGRKPVRLVQVGEAAGARIALAADSLRTSGVEIHGAAKGLDAPAITDAYGQIAAWARDGRLVAGVERVPLREIETARVRTELRGRRLVVVPLAVSSHVAVSPVDQRAGNDERPGPH
jgi:hypothetical protein